MTTPQHSAALNTDEDPSSLLEEQPTLAWLLTGAVLCNDALLEPNATMPHQFQAVGDPTEGALLVVAARLGFWKTKLDKALPRMAEKPFDSTLKRMTTVHTLPLATVPIPDVLKLLQVGAIGTWKVPLHRVYQRQRGQFDGGFQSSLGEWTR